MDYTKTNWQNGDIITAEKLNHIEDGIANNSENACKCNGPTIVVHTVDPVTAKYTADPIEPGLSLAKFAMSTVAIEAKKIGEEVNTVVAVIPFIGAYSTFAPPRTTAYGANIPSALVGTDKDLTVIYDPDTGELSIDNGELPPQ